MVNILRVKVELMTASLEIVLLIMTRLKLGQNEGHCMKEDVEEKVDTVGRSFRVF